MVSTNVATVGTPQVQLVQRASAFVNSIGVNMHLGWWDTAWGAGGGIWAGAESKVQNELAYLGVTRVRDGVPGSYDTGEYGQLAADGIKFDFVQTVSSGTPQISSDVGTIAKFSQQYPGSVTSYEGANEYNTNTYTLNGQSSSGNLAWGAVDDQATQQTFSANSTLAASGVQLIAASTAAVSSGPNIGQYVGASNWHVYGGIGQQLQDNLAAGYAAAQATAPGKPVYITETGVSSASASAASWGVAGDEATQGIIDTNAVLDGFKDGAATTYLYDLMDNNNGTDIEDNFGLFNTDGSPKAAATDLHNLIAILADAGSDANTFAAKPLSDTVVGLPSTASSMVLEKSNGTYDVVVWNGDAQVWNTGADAEATPVPVNITVQLGATYQTVKVFDPMQGSTPVQTLSGVSVATVSLAKNPLVIEVDPNPAGQTYSPGAAGGTITSSGNDTVQVGTGAVTVDAIGSSIKIQGGAGALTYSGTAKATIVGGTGAMNLTLSGSGSSVTGGTGAMTVLDNVGGNTIVGAAGNGGDGITVTTVKGNDLIETGAQTATNTINLGRGNDTVVANGTSVIKGTSGNDAITVNGWWGNVTTSTGASSVTLNTNGAVTTNGNDTVVAVNALTIAANGPSATVTGGNGSMWFTGGGNATIIGGSGGGHFDFTGGGNHVLTTAAGATDVIQLGAKTDVVNAQGNDTIHCSTGADTISVLAGATTIYGGSGSLSFTQGKAAVEIAAGTGNEIFNMINGSSGDVLTISGFLFSSDTIHLSGYSGSGIKSEQVVGGSTQIVLTDSTQINLIGITNPTAHPIFS